MGERFVEVYIEKKTKNYESVFIKPSNIIRLLIIYTSIYSNIKKK